jgi:hypothetical protein
MEIKIVDKNSGSTHIFEGNEIFYDFTRYENIEEYKNIYYSIDNKFNWVICSEPEKIKNFPGLVVYMSFKSDGELFEGSVNDSVIYITNNGQTIDKIVC